MGTFVSRGAASAIPTWFSPSHPFAHARFGLHVVQGRCARCFRRSSFAISSIKTSGSSAGPTIFTASRDANNPTMSRKFSVWLPTTIATPCCAGSMMLCPPRGTRLPPTNATSAKHKGKRVRRWCRVERLRRRWGRHSRRNAAKSAAKLLEQFATSVKALGMARGQNHHSLRIAGQYVLESAQQQ